MTIVGVDSVEPARVSLMTGNFPIGHDDSHGIDATADLCGRHSVVFDDIPAPLVVDLSRPPELDAPMDVQPHEDVAKRCREKHVGVWQNR